MGATPDQPIHVIAPARIDLAGGTLDIWPLYLLLHAPVTINVAISLHAHVKITPAQGSEIVLISKDLNQRVVFDSPDQLHHDHSLKLLSQVLSFFSPETGLIVETNSEVPAGAGLAGSSTLNIALCYALNCFTGQNLSKSKLQLVAKNIEARVIGVPTGDQDYYPALFGNINSLDLGPEGVSRALITTDDLEFQKRALLVYSGSSRESGINNWEIFKRVIDGDKEIISRLNHVSRIASGMKTALLKKDMDLVGELLNEEWRVRKTLGPNVSTPRIDEIISIGMRHGGVGAKVCGAGGGGCIFLLSKSGKKDQLKRALVKSGVSVLDFAVDTSGVRLYSE